MKATANEGKGKRKSLSPGWVALSVMSLAILAACGGGGGGTGGGGSTSGGTSEQPSGGTTDTSVTVDALPSATHALRVQVDSNWSDLQAAALAAGGTPVMGWNLRDTSKTMVPGMKVAFFGVSDLCDTDAANGPVVSGEDSQFSRAQALTGVAATATRTDLRWTPSGATTACAPSAQSLTGPNWIFVNPADSGGGIGMLTQVGPDLNGQPPFLQATSSSGIDGNGYNANGLANFVAFRQAWNTTSAIRPWAASSDGTAVDARVLTRQSMGSADVGTGSGATVQVKQQVMVSLINTECQKGTQRPCQIQYLFNTAAVRTGVTDWATYSPATNGKVWFDAAQAGLPIVAGLVPAKGKTVVDTDSGLALYSSAGAESQHATFSNQPFDMRVSFAQLLNAARIIAARQLGIAPAQVTEEQMAVRWSSQWNQPSSWTLVSSTFGHEIYNDAAGTRHSHIGGGLASLYVGPVR
ncbi:hypothetical protein [Ideonella oryzae]|uniref:Uncharacterized protein n=1 Tax=Ideonella oryzae TaxID=2937441 RepID=A0ABT1BQZ7_9BURK|nr:hypothetical protein [Ideonella oryzae]MCO5978608.1 hypothetical protein [Ideonella oryzae]